MINKLILYLIVFSPCSIFGQGLNDFSLYVGYSGSSSEQLILNSNSFPKSLASSIDISLRYGINSESKFNIELELGYQYIFIRHKVFSTFISYPEQSTFELSLSRVNISLLSGTSLNNRWKVYSGLDVGYFTVPQTMNSYENEQFVGNYKIHRANLFSAGLPINLRYKMNVNTKSIILSLTMLKVFYNPFTIELNGKYSSSTSSIERYQYLFNGDSLRLGLNIPLI